MRLALRKCIIGAILLLSWVGPCMCQGVPGVQMFSTNENGVDVATGNINVNNILVRSKVGKIPFWSRMAGTSGMSLSPNYWWQSMWLVNGLMYFDPTVTYFSVTPIPQLSHKCSSGTQTYTIETVHYPTVTDSTGATHTFLATWQIGSGPAGSGCDNPKGTWGPAAATDGSGHTLVITNGNPTLYYPNGDQVTGVCQALSC